MNPFKAIRRGVTAPVRAATSTARLLTLRKRGVAVLELADEAAEHPALYRDLSWWRRLLAAGAALVDAIPLPQTGRLTMQNVLLKVGIVAGLVVTVGHDLLAPEVAGLLPPKAVAIIGAIVSLAGTVAALYHPTPTKPAAPPPSTTDVPSA